jgi:uncharacterized protein (TIGR00369 family)
MKPKKIAFAELAEFVENIPFNGHCGIRLEKTHPDGVTIGVEVEPHLLNGGSTLHGGLTATLADVAAGIAVSHVTGKLRAATTVEMKVNYLRPAMQGQVHARARLVRVGSTLCTASVEVSDVNKKQLVAVALVTYMLLGK